MSNKIKRYYPNDVGGMYGCEFGDWIKEDDLILIKNELGEIMSGMEFRSSEENKKLLRRIFDKI